MISTGYGENNPIPGSQLSKKRLEIREWLERHEKAWGLSIGLAGCELGVPRTESEYQICGCLG